MHIERLEFATCDAARDVAVVIDVLRAATTAAFALAAGARELVLIEGAERALSLRPYFPGSLVMGEVAGQKPPAFDLGNSPCELLHRDLRGRTLLHATGAGTTAAARCRSANVLFFASFVTARATAQRLRDARAVSLVVSGTHCGFDGDEDFACADYLQGLLRGRDTTSPNAFLERVRASYAGRCLNDPRHPEFSPRDLELACDANRFDFAVRAAWRDGLLIAQMG